MQGVIVDSVLDGFPFARFYVTDSSQSEILSEAASRYAYVFAYSLADLGELDGFTREKKWTQLVALAGTKEEVFASLRKNNRYKVRRTERIENVRVVVDDPARADSYSFYLNAKRADGVEPDIEEDFGSVRWINAYYEDRLVSSTCWFDSGEILRAKHIVSTRKSEGEDTALIGWLTRRLFWEACALGVDIGRRYVDLGGLDPRDPAKQGVRDFKTSFGGELAEIHVYRYATEEWGAVVTRARDNGRVVV